MSNCINSVYFLVTLFGLFVINNCIEERQFTVFFLNNKLRLWMTLGAQVTHAVTSSSSTRFDKKILDVIGKRKDWCSYLDQHQFFFSFASHPNLSLVFLSRKNFFSHILSRFLYTNFVNIWNFICFNLAWLVCFVFSRFFVLSQTY